ncbi:hypothetical protein [Pantoea sp. VS1]|uniref:hypothetical protein n=1 Tax=Pantoea sp. VS1 TaxID=2003658 RepID=UPI0026CC379F
MAMTAAQINAFKTASGNIDISVLYLVSVGLLLCVVSLGSLGCSGCQAWTGKYLSQGCRASPICYPFYDFTDRLHLDVRQ